MPKPMTPQTISRRRPSTAASQPDIGVTIAVATMLKVTTQAIWSGVDESEPCICGSATLAIVTVMA